MSPDFRIQTTATPGVRSVKVTGELDSGTCDALLKAFEDALAERGDDALTLDLRDVSFIDSTGMRSMIQTQRIAQDHGVRLVVVPPPEDVTELLRTAGIAERMNLAATPDGGPLGHGFLDRVKLELEREPRAPSLARAEVREALEGRLGDPDIATVVLLTSELVTNAVIHPRIPMDSTIALTISLYERGVRVEVEDSGEGFDPPTPAPGDGDGGRGLFLVDRCAASWGAQRTEAESGERFCVWFEFLSGDRARTAVGW